MLSTHDLSMDENQCKICYVPGAKRDWALPRCGHLCCRRCWRKSRRKFKNIELVKIYFP